MTGQYEYRRTELQEVAEELEDRLGLTHKQAQNKLAGLLGFSNWHALRKSASLGIVRSKVSPDELAARVDDRFVSDSN